MTIMTIRIPDDIAAAFDKAFEGQNKDAVIAGIIRQALENRPNAKDNPETNRAGETVQNLVEQFRALRASMPPMTDEEIRHAREELRREAGY